MKRRDFLKVSSMAGASSFLLDNCGKPDEKLIPLLIPEEELVPSVDAWVNTLCQQCGAGCGISVRVMPGESIRIMNGKPSRVWALQAKKIEGNAQHPLNEGKTCARGQAGLQVLYNPDRIQWPLKLTGKRGSGHYQPIGWDEAMKVLVASLKSLKDANTPESLVFLTGDSPRASFKTLLERFATAFGTPFLIYHEVIPQEVLHQSYTWCTGFKTLPIADIENSRYLLSFGADLFETFLSPVRYNLAYGRMRRAHPGIRGKFVMAAPRLSMTAANADEWLPIKPGSEGLLALSLAHVIVRESLHDRNFVTYSCSGSSEYFQLLEHYSPTAVAPDIDIAAETIERLAREFAQRRPSLAVGNSADFQAMTAIHALNALVGSYGRPGGILQDSLPPEPSLPSLPGPVPHTVARPPFHFANPPGGNVSSALDSLLHHLLVRQPAPAKVLLLHEANPVYSQPLSSLLSEALEKVTFVAAFSSFMNETTSMADLILPCHTYLESWRDDIPNPGIGVPIRTLAPPVVKLRFDTRDTADVLLDVARTLGGNLAEALPWKNFESLIQESFRPLQLLMQGSVVEETFDAFWDKVKAAGGWWNPKDDLRFAFDTPERKFHLMKARPAVSPAASGMEDERDFPLLLHLYASSALSDGRGANQPWLQEMPDPMTTVMWGSWVELNPNTAARLGIEEGDAVVVETNQGRIELPVYLYPGLRPEVIAIPLGQGHQSYGRYASGRGPNPLLLAPVSSGSGPLLSGIRARISPLGRKKVLARFGAEGRAHSQHPVRR
jgi:menaquinone reductase, molybdopterin-binding-like subunit